MFNLNLTGHILTFVCIVLSMSTSNADTGNIHKNQLIGHDLEVELHIKDNKLTAVDHVLVHHNNAEKVMLFLNGSFNIRSVSSSQRKFDFLIKKGFSDEGDGMGNFSNVQHVEIDLPADVRERQEIPLDIAYEGVLQVAPYSKEEEDVGRTTGIISEEGVYLSPACMWYPDMPHSMATFRITVITPAGYESVTQGARVSKKVIDDKTITIWDEKNVSEGCHLVAGKYTITSINHNGIDVYAYFFPEDQGLVKSYVAATTRYLDMYQKLIGPYPYTKFAIVENFFQTGYGMPSFTLLGSTVVKLPFIVDISLGHEILHNWWGNSVFVDESQGNWCEGITAYMADYYYKELKDAAAAQEYRWDICRKYTNYVTEQNDLPLKKFVGRHDQVTQSVGYGKTAMVFHMLRRIVGDEQFYQSIKRFYREKIWQQASWNDLQGMFEDTCKINLSWFFDQWINRTGAPLVELGKTEVEKLDDGWLTKVEIIQRGAPYCLFLPISLELDDGSLSTTAELRKSPQEISIKTKSQPRGIAIDPHHDVFRRLYREEIPPTIDLVLGDKDRIIVYPTGGDISLQAAYKELAKILAEGDGLIKADAEVTDTDIARKSLFILGGLKENKLTKVFRENIPNNFSIQESGFAANDVSYYNKGDAFLITMRNPGNGEKGITLFLGFDSDTIKNLAYKIPRYGKYSYLVFKEGKNIDKGIFAVSDSPLKRYIKK